MKCWSCEKFLTCPLDINPDTPACEHVIYEPGSDEKERSDETE